ncbi:fibroblast growth factor receptor 1-A-like isoform X2 [Oculina patagonica]
MTVAENILSSSFLYLMLFQILPQTEGVLKFTLKPPNPSYAKKGSDAKLVWDYSVDNKQAELAGIIYSVQVSGGAFKEMLVQQSDGSVVNHPNIPSVYKGRVKVEGNASLVIVNVTSQDNTKFRCALVPTSGSEMSSDVQLIVTEAPQVSSPLVQATYIEGSLVNISCTASGTPDPDVKWIRNSEVKSSGKKTAFLAFNGINRTDDGQYTCRASNQAGNDEKHVTLEVNYPPTIKEATASAAKSWIGQTVSLKCMSDGVPTPTLTWYKPDGNQIKKVTATENIASVKMNVDHDFGGYKCDADNGLTPADFKIVKLVQIKKPGAPSVVIGQSDIQATSLTVKWTAPADDGGSPITAYRVVIQKGGTEIKNENATVPGTTSLPVRSLERDTDYTVKVFARNAIFEGPAGEKQVKTKYEGVPATAVIEDLPSEVTDHTITLKWNEPQSYGSNITYYIVYQRIVTDGKPGKWTKIKEITDNSAREWKVELEKGNVYEFVVTATNELGESLKEDSKIIRVKATGESPTITSQSKGKVTVVEGNMLYLFCKADGYPKPLVTWSKDGKLLQSSTNDTNFITNEAKENDAGNYECKASNSVGTVKYTVEVTIKGSSCKETIIHIVYILIIFLLLIIIVILIILLRRLRSGAGISKTNRRNMCTGCGRELVALKSLATETENQSTNMMPSGDSTNYAVPNSGEDYMPLHPSGRRWEINREQVKIIKVIGKGAFSQVAKATAWNIRGNEENRTVAVKMLKANAPDSDRKDLLAEVELMKKLKPHPHVIKLMACVTETDPLLVLIEYVPFGDLLGYLRKSRGLNDTYFKDPDVKPQTSLTAEQLIRFAWQVADGMFYLSSKKIIHRDLAARNVLVGEGEKCKVTDFGMARNVHQDDIYTKQSRGRLPVKWTAYEALLYGTYTTQSDVWSYGVLLYEILTVGGSPYPGINARQIARKLQEGFRMPKPKHVDNKLYQTMLKCWEENPNDRPSFAKLKDTMKDMERNHRTYVNLEQYDNSLYANVEDLTAD